MSPCSDLDAFSARQSLESGWRPPSAMVLCAGLGTRLRPLTLERPKPLLPVGDRSVLAHIHEYLTLAGLTRVALNTHGQGGEFRDAVATLSSTVHVVHEETLRGTAGGLAGARAFLGEGPVLVWNGDILAEPDLEALTVTAAEGVALAFIPRPSGEGNLGVGEGGRVVRLRGERFGEELSGGVGAGLSAIGPVAMRELPEFGCLVADLCLPWLRAGRLISALPLSGPWTDVGTVESYWRANLAWLDSSVRSLPSSQAGARSWVAPSARVSADVVLDRSLVGESAVVVGAGRLERCVVWPGARAEAPLKDCIVTPRRVVDVGF